MNTPATSNQIDMITLISLMKEDEQFSFVKEEDLVSYYANRFITRRKAVEECMVRMHESK